MPGLKPAILIVLDQMMVRVPWKRERIEPKGINHWLFKQPQVGLVRLQMARIKVDKVMPKDEVGWIGELV